MRTVYELAGDSLREIGILFIVFVPLDAAFYQGDLRLSTVICLVILTAAGFFLVVAGILLERTEED